MKKKYLIALSSLCMTCALALGVGCSDPDSSPSNQTPENVHTLVVTPLNVYTYEEEGFDIKSSLDISTRIYLYEDDNKPITDFTLQTELLSGSEYVSLNNNVLTAIQKAEGDTVEANVKVKVTYEGKTYEKEREVDIKQAYTEGDLGNFVAATTSVEYRLTNKTIDGVENPYEFFTKDLDNLEAWNCRITSTSITAATMPDCYKKEYRYMTFDFYFGGEQGKTQLMPCMGPHRVGWLDETNVPNNYWIKIIEDGKITNVLKHNTWQTVVVDLKQFYDCSTNATFELCNNHNSRNTSTYLSDLRYWHTEDYLKHFEDVSVGNAGKVESVNPPFWDDANVDVKQAFITPSGSKMQISDKQEIAGKQAWKLSVQRPEDLDYQIWAMGRVEADLVSFQNAYSYKYLDITLYVPEENNAFRGLLIDDNNNATNSSIWSYVPKLGWSVSGDKIGIYDEAKVGAPDLGYGQWRTVRVNLENVIWKNYFVLAFELFKADKGNEAFIYISEMKFTDEEMPEPPKAIDENGNVDVKVAFMPTATSITVSDKMEFDGKQAWKVSIERPENGTYSVWENGRLQSNDMVSFIQANADVQYYLDITFYVPTDGNAFKGIFLKAPNNNYEYWTYKDGLNWVVDGTQRTLFDENGNALDNIVPGQWITVRFDVSSLTENDAISLAFDMLSADVGNEVIFYISEMKFTVKDRIIGGNMDDDVANDKWA